MRITVLPQDPDEPAEPLVYEFDRDVVRIGRRRRSDVRLPDRSVSLDHARILRSGGACFVQDADSTNGTRLGTERLVAGRRYQLRSGDVLHVGSFDLLFAHDEAGAETTSEETAQFARRLLGKANLPADADSPYLEVVSGDRSGLRLRLTLRDGAAPYRLGRGPGCDLVLADPDASREHLEIARDFSGVRVRDLGSKNGLVLNGRPARGEHALAHGDRIRVGTTRLRFVDPIEDHLRALDESAEASAPAPWRGERAALLLAVSTLLLCAAFWLWLLL
jgi:pSer/pThr/pTyr-binding forkhead associated (FHA) protein